MNEEMKETIYHLLQETGRSGIVALIDYMEENGFFSAPCSTNKHLSEEDGLAKHSLNVVYSMMELNKAFKSDLPYDSIVICGLLHDLGKMGDHGKANYVENILKSGKASESKPYKTNPELLYIPHEVRSVMIAERFIELTEEEELAILWHNGLYSLFKYDIPGKETLLYFLLHTADMYSSRFLEKTDGNMEKD